MRAGIEHFNCTVLAIGSILVFMSSLVHFDGSALTGHFKAL